MVTVKTRSMYVAALMVESIIFSQKQASILWVSLESLMIDYSRDTHCHVIV